MKLLVNVSMMGPKPTGLGVYTNMCLANLRRTFSFNLIASEDFSAPEQKQIISPKEVAIGGGVKAALKRQLWLRSLSFDSDTLVYSPTHHGVNNAQNQIITIHDMICLRFPSQHRSQYLYFKYALPKLIKRCSAVFTVSQTTRKDINEVYGFPLERIHVVPNAISPSEFFSDQTMCETERKPFLLMVGARYPHKNVEEVLDMSSMWVNDYRLLITSAGGKYGDLLRRVVAERGLGGSVEFLEYIDRETLVTLYRNCAALLYPSKWEGFGIPPLEAMAAGARVIASDIEVHREIFGSACDFVRLGDSTTWESAFSNLKKSSIDESKKQNAQVVLEKYSVENSRKALMESLMAVEPRLSAALSGERSKVACDIKS